MIGTGFDHGRFIVWVSWEGSRLSGVRGQHKVNILWRLFYMYLASKHGKAYAVMFLTLSYVDELYILTSIEKNIINLKKCNFMSISTN